MKRLPDESFEDYKERRKKHNNQTKKYLRGRLFRDSFGRDPYVTTKTAVERIKREAGE